MTHMIAPILMLQVQLIAQTNVRQLSVIVLNMDFAVEPAAVTGMQFARGLLNTLFAFQRVGMAFTLKVSVLGECFVNNLTHKAFESNGQGGSVMRP